LRAEAHHARIGPFYFPPFAVAASVEARVEHAASVGGGIQQRNEDSPVSRIYLPGNASKARLREAERARRNRAEIVRDSTCSSEKQTAAARTAAADRSAPAVAASAPDLSALMDPYVRIQQALNLGMVDGVRERPREIAAQAKALGPDAEAIRLAAMAIAAVRSAFGTLGDALIAYAKERHAPLGAGVKVAYCPMVRKYWLQRGETIQNPYYGQQMSDCGRFVADLPSVGQPATSGTTTRSQQGQQGRSQARADKSVR